MTAKDPYIESAYQQLKLISQDEEKRFEYEAREKAIHDHLQYIKEAEERGIERGAVQIAQNLLRLNVPLETISKGTGLSVEAIRALQK